jgi:hypothetical protein
MPPARRKRRSRPDDPLARSGVDTDREGFVQPLDDGDRRVPLSRVVCERVNNERVRCTNRARWVVWVTKYPRKRHLLCDDCVEPVRERLGELKAPTLKGFHVEPLDADDRRAPVVFGDFGR